MSEPIKRRRSDTILLLVIAPLLAATLTAVGWMIGQIYDLNARVASIRTELRLFRWEMDRGRPGSEPGRRPR